jgi:hypothetical protein
MWLTALATLGCFLGANIFSVFMVQAEARNAAFKAGIFEAGYALFWIVAARYSVNTLNGHGTTRLVVMLSALVLGNFAGAYIGTKWGERLVRDHEAEQVDERLLEAEAALLMAEATLKELSEEIEHHHEADGHDS